MDLAQLANLGEFIGGAAVLVTLIYLAVQVRSNGREQRMLSMREATREMASVNQSVGDSKEKAELWLKGSRDFEELDAVERLRFSVANGHIFRTLEQIYYQEREGGIEPELWRGFMNQLRDVAAYPGIQAWWTTRSHWYGERFCAFVQPNMSGDNQPSMFDEPQSERQHS